MESQVKSVRSSEHTSQSFPQRSAVVPGQGIDTVKRRRGKKVETVERATWDKRTTKTFIDLCVDEVRNGNKPGSHFNKIGWKNIVQKFYVAMNRSYSRIQLKNRWDGLRKEWKDWKALVQDETGISWDADRGTVVADEDWWAKKIEEFPEVAKFKDQGPLWIYEQELLFDDVTATDSRLVTPISSMFPVQMQDNNDDSLEERNEPSGSPATNLDIPTPNEVEVHNMRRKNPFPSVIPNKSKAASVAETIANSPASMMEHMKSKQASARPASMRFSINECMEVLDRLNGIEEGDEMWLFATDLFLNSSIRELFLSIKKDETRMVWLKRQMEKDMNRKASFYMSAQGSDRQTRDNTSSC